MSTLGTSRHFSALSAWEWFDLISLLECNNFGLHFKLDPDSSTLIPPLVYSLGADEQVCVGRALFPKAAFFNHSCDPNLIPVQVGASMLLQCTRPINKGEELCISYLDTSLDVHERRETLLDEYFFTCLCSRCELEQSQDTSQQDT